MMKPFFQRHPILLGQLGRSDIRIRDKSIFSYLRFSISGALEIVLHFSKKQKQFHVQIKKTCVKSTKNQTAIKFWVKLKKEWNCVVFI